MKLYFTILLAALFLIILLDIGESGKIRLRRRRRHFGLHRRFARSLKTLTVRDSHELNDAFNALVVKPECQHLPLSMVQAKPECLNNIEALTED
ncbi:hypothetical protein OS493_033366 [Desmophyllum pertusum]|uniref:Uncharacterized protein n=1 Tax=Desmophyllum pertusum TaxID=174260 RepID=A0A9X0CP68_9CNID|nr:hypothetical protein OS493_033366 [Desmophyllum pertusum]